jgi:hypothetical protein
MAKSQHIGQLGLSIGLFWASTAPKSPISGEAHLRQRLLCLAESGECNCPWLGPFAEGVIDSTRVFESVERPTAYVCICR